MTKCLAKCSFCDKKTAYITDEKITGGWGYLEVQKAGWKECLVVIHCPKHATEYIDFLYHLGAVATIEGARHLIDNRRESSAIARVGLQDKDKRCRH